MGGWVEVIYVTESAAAAQWRYAHLQSASGYIRSAPGPYNTTYNELKAMQMRSIIVVVVGRSGISHIICLLDHA